MDLYLIGHWLDLTNVQNVLELFNVKIAQTKVFYFALFYKLFQNLIKGHIINILGKRCIWMRWLYFFLKTNSSCKNIDEK